MLFLSDEIICEIFRGTILKGRLVSKDILSKLWSAGSVNRPIFFRPAVAFTRPTRNDLAFLSRFRFAILLVPYAADSQEARELAMAARDFSIITMQEITVADVKKAARAGFEETCSLIDGIVTSNIPVPSLSVLQHIMELIRHVESIKPRRHELKALWFKGAQFFLRVLELGVVSESEGHVSCALQCLLKLLKFRNCYICKVVLFECLLQRENARHRFMSAQVLFYLLRDNPKHSALLETAAKTLMELYRIACHDDKTRTAAFLEKLLRSPDEYIVRRALQSVETASAMAELAQSKSSTREQRLTAALVLCALFYNFECDRFPDEYIPILVEAANGVDSSDKYISHGRMNMLLETLAAQRRPGVAEARVRLVCAGVFPGTNFGQALVKQLQGDSLIEAIRMLISAADEEDHDGCFYSLEQLAFEPKAQEALIAGGAVQFMLMHCRKFNGTTLLFLAHLAEYGNEMAFSMLLAGGLLDAVADADWGWSGEHREIEEVVCASQAIFGLVHRSDAAAEAARRSPAVPAMLAVIAGSELDEACEYTAHALLLIADSSNEAPAALQSAVAVAVKKLATMASGGTPDQRRSAARVMRAAVWSGRAGARAALLWSPGATAALVGLLRIDGAAGDRCACEAAEDAAATLEGLAGAGAGAEAELVAAGAVEGLLGIVRQAAGPLPSPSSTAAEKHFWQAATAAAEALMRLARGSAETLAELAGAGAEAALRALAARPEAEAETREAASSAADAVAAGRAAACPATSCGDGR